MKRIFFIFSVAGSKQNTFSQVLTQEKLRQWDLFNRKEKLKKNQFVSEIGEYV